MLLLVLSALFGWIIGRWNLPALEGKLAWVLLFGVVLSFVVVLVLFRSILRSKSKVGTTSTRKRKQFFTAIILLQLALGVGTWAYLANEQATYLENFADELMDGKQQLQFDQAETLAALRNRQNAPLISNLVYRVKQEAEKDSLLPKETIVALVSLNQTFEPYLLPEGDSLSPLPLSPERGQLLLALTQLSLDSALFVQIKKEVSFAHADLRNQQLMEVDWSHVQLEGANLRGSDLSGACLRSASLVKADLWGVKMPQADLKQANLRRAILAWADVSEAQLAGARLSGANFQNAHLRQSDFSKAIAEWSNFHGSDLRNSNWEKANLKGSEFHRAHLDSANLSATKLVWTDFQEAQLRHTQFEAAAVHQSDWLTGKLKEWRITDPTELQQRYQLIPDTTKTAKFLIVSQ